MRTKPRRPLRAIPSASASSSAAWSGSIRLTPSPAGSNLKYSRSAIRLKKITDSVSSMKIACSSGKSRLSIASTVSRPRPGYENTYSTVIDPPMMKPSESATSVMIGSIALRSPCLRTIVQFFSPLARAVST